MIKVFDIERSVEKNRASINAAIQRVIDSGQFILGQEVSEFEKEFARYLDCKYVIGVANGSDALYLALAALGLNQSSKIATVANAGFYGSSAISRLGAQMKFIDVDIETSNTNLESVRSVGTSIDAIIVTHLYGRAVEDIQLIAEYCKKHGIALIEDCAQAAGASIDGKKVGNFGDIASFSFYPTKNLGALGDGGAVITNSASLMEKVKSLREYGWKSKYSVEIEGGINSRLDEFQAAILRVLLPNLDAENERRARVARLLTENINAPQIISLPACTPNFVAHLYVLRTSNRDELEQKLKLNGIGFSVHYPVPDYLQPIIKVVSQELPSTKELATQILTIPCHSNLTDTEIEKIIRVINN